MVRNLGLFDSKWIPFSTIYQMCSFYQVYSILNIYHLNTKFHIYIQCNLQGNYSSTRINPLKIQRKLCENIIKKIPGTSRNRYNNF